jgi:hypothetical protein
MNALLLQSNQIKQIINTLPLYCKSKEKIDMILEPFQAMIQLAFLSMSPIGTKLTIQENILYLQVPSLIQPVSRWYYSDKRDDLYYLFQVINRFIKWYNPQNISSPIKNDLFQLIIKMSIKGLDNLIKTYNNNNNLIQIINIYKTLLENYEISFNEKNTDEKMNIDRVFKDITQIYDENFVLLINNIFVIIENETDINNIFNLIDGFNLIMIKKHKQIKNWIKVNLIF